ncbi:MAG: type II toxin-antitoxin system RelE/ParE family toxin [Bacteroidota bacterium]|nr:type II toxin-antitoxin system RelE/ParE family toxin [Bacteroidota bacterium]
MEVITKSGFRKDLRKCPNHIQQKTGEIINILEKAENLQTSGVDYKKMKGGKKDEDFYRIRVGDWRIGIELLMPSIIIFTILHRGEIYKHFPPK